MIDILMYTKSNCPNCLAAKMVLKMHEFAVQGDQCGH